MIMRKINTNSHSTKNQSSKFLQAFHLQMFYFCEREKNASGFYSKVGNADYPNVLSSRLMIRHWFCPQWFQSNISHLSHKSEEQLGHLPNDRGILSKSNPDLQETSQQCSFESNLKRRWLAFLASFVDGVHENILTQSLLDAVHNYRFHTY